MHFHLPKPLHGWREFAGEVGIIVIGVLIALGAEQLVEAAHRQREGVQAEGTIRDEIELNLGRLQSRRAIHSCVNRRIEDIQALLDSAASNPDITTPTWIGRRNIGPSSTPGGMPNRRPDEQRWSMRTGFPNTA
jgi:hypothetical protein